MDKITELDKLLVEQVTGRSAGRTRAAAALIAAAQAVARLPRGAWPGFVALFFECLEEADAGNQDGPDIIQESMDALNARIKAGRW